MPLFGKREAEELSVAGVTLRCEICHHTKFWERKAQLHGAVASFFDLELEKARTSATSQPFMRLAGVIRGGPRDVSTRKGFSRK